MKLAIDTDLLDHEIEFRLPLRDLVYLINITNLYIEMTGDQELLDLYEQLYQNLEPYGSVTSEDDEDGKD